MAKKNQTTASSTSNPDELREAPGDGIEKDVTFVGSVGPGETLSATAEGDGTGEALEPIADVLADIAVQGAPGAVEAKDAKLARDQREAAEHAEVMADKAARDAQATQGAEGDASDPDAPKGDEGDADAPSADEPQAQTACDHFPKLPVKVWPHGTVEWNHKVFEAGTTVEICPCNGTEEQAEELVKLGAFEIVSDPDDTLDDEE